MSAYKDEKKGTYYFKCRVNGKHTMRRGFKTRQQALKAERELKETKINAKLFGDIANEYINLLASNKNESAYSYLCQYRKHIELTYAKKRIDKIKRSDIKDLQNAMLNKKYNGKHYAPRTINQVTSTFNSILNYAVLYEFIEKNPCSNFKMLKEVKNHETVKFWTNSQFQHAIKFEKDLVWFVYLTLSYLTGMRKGEVRALKWIDIDFRKREININRHINDKPYDVDKKNNSPNLSEGRKNSGTHIVSMDNSIYDLLRRLKEHDMTYDGWNEDTFLFGIFKPVGQYTPNRHLIEIAKQAKLPIISIHGLRHSHVSYLIEKGLDYYEIANRIGDKTEMVLNIYGHMFPNKQANVVQVLNDNFEFKFERSEK